MGNSVSGSSVNRREGDQSAGLGPPPSRGEVARRVGLIVSAIFVVLALSVVAFTLPGGSPALYIVCGAGGGASLLAFCALALSYCCRSRLSPPSEGDEDLDPLKDDEKDSPSPTLSSSEESSTLSSSEESDDFAKPPTGGKGVVDSIPSPPLTPPPSEEEESFSLRSSELGISFLDMGNSSTIGTYRPPSPPLWEEIGRPPSPSPFQQVANYVSNAARQLAAPGEIQQRTQFYQLSSVIDGLLRFLDKGGSSDSPLRRKTNMVDHLVQGQFPELGIQHYDEKGAPLYSSVFDFHLVSLLQTLYLLPTHSNWAELKMEFFRQLNGAYNHRSERAATPEKVTLLREIAYHLFTETSLQSYAHSALFEIVDPVATGSSVSGQLLKDREKCEKRGGSSNSSALFTPAAKLNGQFGINFAPLEDNNFSSSLCQTEYVSGESSRTVKLIRYGTPTMESLSNNPEVIPAFRLFLEACQVKGKRIVALQHQNPEEKRESPRLAVMDKLAEEYKGTFFVLRLPMDGNFFNQKDECAGDEWGSMIHFKDELNKALKENLHGIQLPQPEGSHDEIKEIVNRVHGQYFENVPSLNAENRKLFQLLVYVYLGEYFSIRLGAEFRSSQCKDTLDRSMTINVLSHFLNLIRMGEEGEEDQLRHLRAMVNGYGLLVKDIPMHGNRFELLCAALGLMEKKIEAIREGKIKVNGQEWTFKKSALELVPHQEFKRMPCEAASKEQYEEYIAREEGILSCPLEELSAIHVEEKQCGRDIIAGKFQVRADNQEVTLGPSKEYNDLITQTREKLNISEDEAGKLLKLSTQRTICEIASVLTKRYDNDTLSLFVAQKAELPIGINWEREDKAFRYVAGYCAFLLRSTEEWEPKKRYICGKVRIDLKTRKAVLSWTAPSKDEPKDLEAVIKAFDTPRKNDGKAEK